ncbi:MAG: hypothetical protein ABH843_04030 [Candidatus Omnitrophota bacterium]
MRKYDFGIAWDGTTEDDFVKWVKSACVKRNMLFKLINENNVHEVIKDLNHGKLKISFMLDTEANYNDPEDIFTRLCYAVKDTNGYVACDPDDARDASNKAIAHYDLVKAKIPTPYTIVVRNWEPDDFSLTKEELKELGVPFVIKPATGFGQKGVLKTASGSITEIAQARHFNRGDDFLLQKKIDPVYFDKKQGWFRVYFLFGEIIPCWWNTETGFYTHLTLKEMYTYKLLPLARITSEISRITNMDFFTTEIAVTMEKKEKKFVAIDYVNDQPDLNIYPVKQGGGPVPEVVLHIAESMADIAWKMKNGIFTEIYRSIWLAKAQTKDESI